MATKVFNPKKNKVVDAVKKGVKNNNQSWLDKEDNTRFITPVGAENNIDQTTGQFINSEINQKKPKKEIKTSEKEDKITEKEIKTSEKEPKKTTEIFVNGNKIKTLDGDISVETALSLIGAYFQNLAAENASIKKIKDVTTITFKVNAGSKGK